jgi:hypothetical protein
VIEVGNELGDALPEGDELGEALPEGASLTGAGVVGIYQLRCPESASWAEVMPDNWVRTNATFAAMDNFIRERCIGNGKQRSRERNSCSEIMRMNRND